MRRAAIAVIATDVPILDLHRDEVLALIKTPHATRILNIQRLTDIEIVYLEFKLI